MRNEIVQENEIGLETAVGNGLRVAEVVDFTRDGYFLYYSHSLPVLPLEEAVDSYHGQDSRLISLRQALILPLQRFTVADLFIALSFAHRDQHIRDKTS
jgi:hypothetical protein